jgi:hypothetical protein
VQNGPARMRVRSTTRIPESGKANPPNMRPSRQPLRGFLRMRFFLYAINKFASC